MPWRRNVCVERRAQPVAAGVRRREHVVVEDLGERGDAGSHRGDVVVERPGVAQRAATRSVEVGHHVTAPAERSERQAAAEVLAERRHVRRDAESELGASPRQPRRHHLVEDQHGAVVGASRPKGGKELGITREATCRSLHRLDDDGGDLATMVGEDLARRGDVVVRNHQPVVGDVDRVRCLPERQHAAVIGVLAHDDAPPAGVVHGDGEGHQVRLGTGVREADLLDRREAIDDGGGEADLVAVHGAERPAPFEGPAGGGEDRCRVVAEKAGSEVTEQVDVADPVDVPQRGALGPDDADRERFDVERRAAVASGGPCR